MVAVWYHLYLEGEYMVHSVLIDSTHDFEGNYAHALSFFLMLLNSPKDSHNIAIEVYIFHEPLLRSYRLQICHFSFLLHSWCLWNGPKHWSLLVCTGCLPHHENPFKTIAFHKAVVLIWSENCASMLKYACTVLNHAYVTATQVPHTSAKITCVFQTAAAHWCWLCLTKTKWFIDFVTYGPSCHLIDPPLKIVHSY